MRGVRKRVWKWVRNEVRNNHISLPIMLVLLNNDRGQYRVIFRLSANGKRMQISRSLGTKNRKIANEYVVTLQRLCDEQKIHPFDPDFKIKEALRLSDIQNKQSIITLEMAINMYLGAKQGLRSWHKYQIELLAFMNFGGYKYMPIHQINTTMLAAYIHRSTNKGRVLSTSTQNGYWRYLHGLFEFLVQKNYLQTNLVKQVPKPIFRNISKDVISTDSDIDRLFTAFDRYHQKQQTQSDQYREWKKQLWFKPLILLYNATGCRRSQPLTAKWADLDTNYAGIWVKGVKFEHTDKVYYYIKYEEAKAALADLKKATSAKDDDYIFANPKTGQPLTGAHVYKIFKTYVKLAGLNPSLHIHGLRHKSVTDDLNAGLPLHLVSMQHQHSSTAVTEKIYSHLNKKSVTDGYAAFYGKKKRK